MRRSSARRIYGRHPILWIRTAGQTHRPENADLRQAGGQHDYKSRRKPRLTLDLHAGQIQGFFDIPTDNLIISPVFIPDIEKKYEGEDLVIVSPDVGGVVRARAIAKRLNAELAIIDKRREKRASRK